MSSKHFLPKDINSLVTNGLVAALYENENLSILEKERVLFYNKHDESKVALISGGGSGHEPGWYGFVGDSMLSASVQGEVFASPNYRNIQAAEKVVHSQKGTIFLITNYTGDNLYFGMAAQNLINKYGDDKIRILRTTDDVAVSRSNGALVGRRTLSAITLMFKLLGACSDEGYDIDDVYNFGESCNANIASVNAGLDHIHIPTHDKDQDFGKLGPNELELGLGVHNEPGVKKYPTIPTNEELIKMMLKLLLDKNDPERGFFNYEKGDKIVLQLNNLGGCAHIELLAILYEAIKQLKDDYNIEPVRVYHGHFVTSFNAPIFTLTLFNVTKSTSAKFSDEKIFQFLDKPVSVTNWPVTLHSSTEPIDVKSRIITNFKHYDEEETVDDNISALNGSAALVKIDPKLLKAIITTAANNVIAKEPDLTEWDTKMGDGDCGEGLKIGAEAILKALVVDGITDDGSILESLSAILKIVKDDMGGTLGAILYIFLQGFVTDMERILKEHEITDLNEIFVKASEYAITNLCQYTKAREGHRTVMDVLIPFCRKYQETKDIKQAINEAYNCAEGTRKLKPKLGRATYVGIEDKQCDFPPDPGAYGVYEVLKSLDSSQY